MSLHPVHFGPFSPAKQSHTPFSSHWRLVEYVWSQRQGKQPVPLLNPWWLTLQRLQCIPSTPGLHSHWPVSKSQDELLDPCGSQLQPENKNTKCLSETHPVYCGGEKSITSTFQNHFNLFTTLFSVLWSPMTKEKSLHNAICETCPIYGRFLFKM